MRRSFLVLVLLGLAVSASGQATNPAPLFPFVLPWDGPGPAVADGVFPAAAPAGQAGFVVARDGHLFAGRTRLRLLGVNMSFGGNFPRHEDADKVAARLAAFGVNCVRFHHLDTSPAPAGLLQKDARTLDPDWLDRLDYFIAALKKQGVYADLNLHVGRQYPGSPTWDGMPSYFKGVDNFFPRLIELQREYARDLLTHTNRYTGAPYTAEPAVALVEINNENSLVREWENGALDRMPDPYAAELQRQWNEWLRERYRDTAALRRAWATGAEAVGAEMLTNADFRAGTEGWFLEQHQGARATATVAGGLRSVGAETGRAVNDQAPTERSPPTARTLRLTVTQPGQAAWHVQLHQPGLRLAAGRGYTVRLWARASAPRQVVIGLSQAHDPWRGLATGEARLSKEWREFRFVFVPTAGDDNARLIFSGLGLETGEVWLAGVSLRPGGVAGLGADETLAVSHRATPHPNLLPQGEKGSPLPAGGEGQGEGASLEAVRLLTKGSEGARTAVARADWRRFLEETEERYWTGMRRFVREELKSRSLVIGTQLGYSPASVQAKLDVVDVHGYWQHPHFPGRPWDPGNWTVRNESMAAGPAEGILTRMTTQRVAGKPYVCTEYNHPAPNTYSAESYLLAAAVAARDDWDGLFAYSYCHRNDDWDARRIMSYFDIDQHPVKMATLPIAAALLRDRVPRVVWTNGVVTIEAPRTKAVVGFMRGRTFTLGRVRIAPGPTRQDWVAIGLAELAPRRWLLVAAGDVENTEMGWKNPEKTTVGRDWGKAPSLVEGIPATIELPGAVRAWALDERGRRGAEVPVRAGRLAIGPEYQTLWYEVATE